MNCKQGDLAWVSEPDALSYGLFVRCLELIPAGTLCDVPIELGVLWRVDTPIKCFKKKMGPHMREDIPDRYLTPIRGDISDEDVERELAENYMDGVPF